MKAQINNMIMNKFSNRIPSTPSSSHTHCEEQAVKPKSGDTNNHQKALTCFIGGIHIKLKEAELAAHLNKNFPHVQYLHIRLAKSQRDHSANKGFGFITLKSREDFEAIVGQEILLKGKTMVFRSAHQGNETGVVDKRIVVKNLPQMARNKDLREALEKTGLEVERCYIIIDSNNLKSKGIGFVDFKSRKDMFKSLRNPNSLFICRQKVFLEKYKPRVSKKRERKQENGTTLNFNKKEGKEQFQKLKLKKKEEMPLRRKMEIGLAKEFLKPSLELLLNEKPGNYALNRTSQVMSANKRKYLEWYYRAT